MTVSRDPAAPSPANWQPDSWQRCAALQQPTYPDAAALQGSLDQLAALPPLVNSWEVDRLREQLAEVEAGKAFLLQGGDCAESFDDCGPETIVARLKILLQMSLVLLHGMQRPVVRVGRMAGQYAKPRSADSETRDGVTLPSYRGDIINRPAFTEAARTPDPALMLRGYERAAMILNFVRSLVDGGFADLHHPENWDLDFVAESPLAQRYHGIVDAVTDALAFFEGVTGAPLARTHRAEFYTSHEALLLPYEQAQTRHLPRTGHWYCLTAHLPWIGMRTAQLDGAHVEYCRGIANPVGVKVGAGMDDAWLQQLVRVLDPDNIPGRLVLITRFGADAIHEHLPRVVQAVRATGNSVVWVCDPMHGNTESTADGTKTRRFDRIEAEIEAAFRIHRELGSHLGGVHLELTGEDVTECTGGARNLTDDDLQRAYRTQVDPRLNYEQAMEIAMRMVDLSSPTSSSPGNA